MSRWLPFRNVTAGQGRAAGGRGAFITRRAWPPADALKDLFGLEIGEGALVNILDAAKAPFAAQTSRLKADLMSGTVLHKTANLIRPHCGGSAAQAWLWSYSNDNVLCSGNFLGEHQ